MLKFKTSCAVLARLSSNLLNEVGLSLFRYFEVGLRVCDIVVKKFTSAISSPDKFLFFINNALYSIAFGTITKTAEPIKMPFEMMSGLGTRNSVLCGGDDSRRGRNSFGGNMCPTSLIPLIPQRL